jgi:hypothetical protein
LELINKCNSYSGDVTFILVPPAEAIAAEEPVAVDIQIPLDHTFKENNGSLISTGLYEGVTFPLQRVSLNLDTAAGLGCATKISFNAGGKRISM